MKPERQEPDFYLYTVIVTVAIGLIILALAMRC